MVASLPKKKSASSSVEESNTSFLAQITQFEAKLLGPTYNPNPLLPLISLSRHGSPPVVHKAVWSLHRVFIKYISEGKVGGFGGNGKREEEADLSVLRDKEGRESKEVKGWVRDRLLEYLEILGGMIRDSEESLRRSALPLLFSLLPPLSASISQKSQPVIHIPYFRLILHHLLFPTPSFRGATPRKASSSTDTDFSRKWAIVPVNQISLDEGVLPADIVGEVQSEYWAKYDDLRWAFFREGAHLLQSESLPHPDNLLAQLLPLTNLPKVQVDLNTFYIPSFSLPPKSSSKKAKSTTPESKKKKSKKTDEEIDKLPEWMASYDSPSEEEADVPTGSKRTLGRTGSLSIHGQIHSLHSHTTLYTTMWETVLSTIQLDENWTRKITIGLHGSKGILTHMRPDRRVRVADWLGGLVDRGGALAMLAMNGLFLLMTQYNLDYPNFYQKLYALLDHNVLHVRYRARFFRLLDTFLSSTLLPAALVASFIKRLSRLALSAPPAAIIMVIPFVYNLFKRHPGCMVMIQRLESEEIDPYKPDDPSPLTSDAISSSCWELQSLQSHYLASVSTLAKVFNEVFTKSEYSLEDFLDHGYGTLFDTEISRVIKNPPALAMDVDAGDGGKVELFPGERVGGEERGGGDLVGQLWTF